MKIPTKRSILLLTALALLFSGCAAPQLAPTLTSTPRINTATPTITPSATFAPTIQVTPTFPFPMGTEVSWPEPALSASDWQARYDQMMQTNSGCQLPCWWGITPGETTIQEAQEHLHELLPDIRCYHYYGQRICGLANSTMVNSHQVDLNTDIGVLLEEITIVGIQTHVSANYFTLSQVIEQYGAPPEAWILTHPDYGNNNILYFEVLLYYPNISMVARYWTLSAEKKLDTVQACFGPTEPAEIWLWRPDKPSPFEDLGNDSFGPEKWNAEMLPFEQAIGLTPQDFFAGVAGQQTICLDTPASLWVMP